MNDSADDMAMVSSVISLGHDVGLKVVAEGVDSPEQAKLLQLLKCDQMQGFLFCGAVASSEIEALLRKEGAAPLHAGHTALTKPPHSR